MSTKMNSTLTPQDRIQSNLFGAVEQGAWWLIPGLISMGADPNALGPDGCTALHLACHDNQSYHGVNNELITTLLDHGADINALCARGCTPLMHALMHNDDPQTLARLLLRAGADPWIVAPRNRDLCRYDSEEEFEECVVPEGHLLDFLLCCHRHDEPAEQMRWWVLPFLFTELVKDARFNWLAVEAVNDGADVNKPDLAGRTPMQIVADRGCPNMVRFLAANGARDSLEPQHAALREAAERGWAQFHEIQANPTWGVFMMHEGSAWFAEWMREGFGGVDYVFPGHSDWKRMKGGGA